METTTIEMTPSELEQFEAFKKKQEADRMAAKHKEDLSAYVAAVDEMLEENLNRFIEVAKFLKNTKDIGDGSAKALVAIKGQLFGMEKLDNQSHTFTHTNGLIRETYGQYMNDGYRDTVNEGIAIVKDAIKELITDDNSKALVNTILRLLSRDQKGNLKASKVLQLQKTAEESGNELLMKGVKIIQESYQPMPSKTFIRMEIRKDKDSEWETIPSSITEA